jgi:hypothetical protein
MKLDPNFVHHRKIESLHVMQDQRSTDAQSPVLACMVLNMPGTLGARLRAPT